MITPYFFELLWYYNPIYAYISQIELYSQISDRYINIFYPMRVICLPIYPALNIFDIWLRSVKICHDLSFFFLMC